MIINVYIILGLLLSNAISAKLNHAEFSGISSYEICLADTLELNNNSGPGQWYIINPLHREYSNFNNGHPHSLAEIEYTMEYINTTDSKSLNVKEYIKQCGTYYFARLSERRKNELPDTLKEALPLQEKYRGEIVQVVVRKDDSYIGYLYELLGTPFILPPKYIHGYGHQTDLRIGCDCAEFVIYGKRRQGFDIPYCGPRNIYSYLDEINESELKKGDIVHFGEQVSLFFEDKGIINKFDKDDILLQSYDSTAYFTTVENCGFYHYPKRFYRWKKKYVK